MEKQIESLPFLKDRPILVLAALNGVIIFLSLALTVLKLRSHDFKVPIQYVVSDSSVLQSSSWYSLYSLALFTVLGGALTIVLAYKLHKGNRLFSIALLGLYVVVGVVSLLVINALLSLVANV